MEKLMQVTQIVSPALPQPRMLTPQSMTGLRQVAKTAEVTAIHTTNLVSALHVYAKMIRFRDEDAPAGRAVLSCGSEELELDEGRVCDVNAEGESGGDDIYVRFITPSVRRAFDTLRRAGARAVGGVRTLEGNRAAFRLADTRGNVIEIIGQP